MSHEEVFLKVDIIWWDARNFHVKCPYCEETHRHGLNSYADGSRVSHCGHFGSYSYSFPIDTQNGLVAYEIDKAKARFINVCTREDLERNEDDVEQLASEFSSKARLSSEFAAEPESAVDIHTAAQEIITVDIGEGQTFEEKRILFAISDCVTGQVKSVENYLQSSPEATTFIHGKDENGDTTLTMASCETFSEMVSLLLDHGSKINAVNHEGRSALMQATLWGRLDNAKILLKRGADKNLKDHKGSTAADLALPKPRNQRERHTHFGGTFHKEPVIKEDSFSRDADRLEILWLLEGNKSKCKTVYGAPPIASELEDCSFRRSTCDQTVIFCGPVAKYPLTRNNKTVARLERGGKFDIIPAMSGWSHSEWPSFRVSGIDWTNEVVHIADVVGHTLPPSPQNDRGVSGRFNACHAEKQLIAYFIDKHVFLPRDRSPDRDLEDLIARATRELARISRSSTTVTELFKSEELLKDLELELFEADDRLLGDNYDEEKVQQLKSAIELTKREMAELELYAEVKDIRKLQYKLKQLEQKEALHEQLIDIANRPPPESLKTATILVSTSICPDCERFKDKVNRRFELSIKMYRV
jgi:hypothetical protein